MQTNINSRLRKQGYARGDRECLEFMQSTGMDKSGNSRKIPRERNPHRDWASPVIIYDTGATPNGCNDSDRLLMAEWEKYNELCRKHFGNEAQVWGGRSPEKIEAFLRDYFDKPKLVLVQIQKMYNRSNGFPVWHFQYQI